MALLVTAGPNSTPPSLMGWVLIPSPFPMPGTSGQLRALLRGTCRYSASRGPWRSPAPAAGPSSASEPSPVSTYGLSARPSLFVFVLNEVEAANLRQELNNPHLLSGYLEVEGDGDGLIPVEEVVGRR